MLRPRPLRLCVLAASLLGAGCGTLNVSVTRPSAPDGLPPGELGRLARVYLVIERPASYQEGGESALGRAAGLLGAFAGAPDPSSAAELAWDDDALAELARRAAAALKSPLGEAVAWQVGYPDEPAAWPRDFSATGSLVLRASDASLRQEAFEETLDTDKGPQKVRRWRASASLGVDWRFYAEPGHVQLDEGRSSWGEDVSEVFDRPVPDLAAWFKPKRLEAALRFAGPLRRHLLPHDVAVDRTIKKGDDAAAFEAARSGRWDEAAGLWKSRAETQPSDWVAPYNLGVNDERQGLWDRARADYGAARERAQGSDRKKIEALLAELDRVMAPPRGGAPAAAAAPFYDIPTAVLPFSNQSVDLGAPDLLRGEVLDGLRRRGYTLVSLQDVDAALKQKGVLEGGQLDLLRPPQLASLLGADRLLYGDVEEFGAVNVGIFHRRTVRLALKLVDRDGRVLWQNTAQTRLQSGVKPKEAAAAFLEQAAQGLAAKAAKTYLKDEAELTARRALETLPHPFK